MHKKTLSIAGIALLGAFATTPVVADEECFGVVLAGDNDCATSTNACAGHSLEDGQTDAYITVPNGMCLKLVGGSLEPK